MSHPVIYCDRI